MILSAVWIALVNLTGGKIRKLDATNRELAEKMEAWLPRREEYQVLVRVLLVMDVLAWAFLLSLPAPETPEGGGGIAWTRWIVAAGGAAAFFGITEIVGRHFTVRRSARLLATTLPVVRVLSYLVFPLTLLIFLTHKRLARWRDNRTEDGETATAEDEILSLVEQTEAEDNRDNALEEDERRMIRGIFDLDETLVHEIMTPRVDIDGIADTASIADVRAEIVSSGHSRIPVYRETIDRIIGVIYAKDLLDDEKLARAKGLREFYHRPVFIPETKNIGDLLEEFQQNRNHFAIVLDEYGGTAGIVTFEDILEEIVGEIRDEYDDNETRPTGRRLEDGCFIVDARITIDELNELLDTDLPEDDDFDTLGGFISTEAGRIPLAGEVLETSCLRIEVVAADPRRVLEAKVTKLPADPEADAD